MRTHTLKLYKLYLTMLDSGLQVDSVMGGGTLHHVGSKLCSGPPPPQNPFARLTSPTRQCAANRSRALGAPSAPA